MKSGNVSIKKLLWLLNLSFPIINLKKTTISIKLIKSTIYTYPTNKRKNINDVWVPQSLPDFQKKYKFYKKSFRNP